MNKLLTNGHINKNVHTYGIPFRPLRYHNPHFHHTFCPLEYTFVQRHNENGALDNMDNIIRPKNPDSPQHHRKFDRFYRDFAFLQRNLKAKKFVKMFGAKIQMHD